MRTYHKNNQLHIPVNNYDIWNFIEDGIFMSGMNNDVVLHYTMWKPEWILNIDVLDNKAMLRLSNNQLKCTLPDINFELSHPPLKLTVFSNWLKITVDLTDKEWCKVIGMTLSELREQLEKNKTF